MWWFKLYPFLAPPCAALAGLFTWSITRGRRPEDGELLRHFLVALGMLLLASAAITRTEFVRSRYDEGFKARGAYLAMPVHDALRVHRPDEWKQVEQIALKAFDEQVPPATVVTQTRAQYLGLARRMMENAQGTAVTAYAQALVPALEELRTTQPALCVRMAWAHVPGEPFDLGPRVSAPVNAGYERAVARLVAENSTSAVPGSWKPEPRASLREVQAGFVEIRDAAAERYGPVVAQLPTAAVAQADPSAACGATIDVLTRALALEPPVARAILTQLLRG